MHGTTYPLPTLPAYLAVPFSVLTLLNFRYLVVNKKNSHTSDAHSRNVGLFGLKGNRKNNTPQLVNIGLLNCSLKMTAIDFQKFTPESGQLILIIIIIGNPATPDL